MNVWVAGRKVRLEPAAVLGKGGEADVYDIGLGHALKLFKAPDHPDVAGDAEAEAAARERIGEHQSKLRAFPRGLPADVVTPLRLATGRDGAAVLGYTMRLVAGALPLQRLSDRSGRPAGFGGAGAVAVLRHLHQTVNALHAAGVVIGDFNDMNVLVTGTTAHLIDADSFQFGSFLCRMFTERFVDPRLCDPAAARMVLSRPHDAASDWYAFAVLVMRTLLFVDPYGGVLKGARSTGAERTRERITVFRPEVRYPRPALPLEVLPDELLHHLVSVFEKDERGTFPRPLLERLSFRTCQECGLEHGRVLCPRCQAAGPRATSEVTTVRGVISSSVVFRTRGSILAASLGAKGLEVVTQEAGGLRRGGETLAAGVAPGLVRAGIAGRRTLFSWGSRLLVMEPGREPQTLGLDRGECSWAANERYVYWVDGGRLLRDGSFGPEPIGDVLAGQTRIFVGPRFGFGFYRAAELSVAFVFDAEGRRLDDTVRLPRLSGELVEAAVAFSDERAFVFTTARDGARLRNRVVVVRREGRVEAAAETDAGDGSWLGGIHGCAAAGAFLFVPTDEGLVRVEVQGSGLAVTREYPDTEPFVDGGCRLLAGDDGLFVVDHSEVRRLRIG